MIWMLMCLLNISMLMLFVSSPFYGRPTAPFLGLTGRTYPVAPKEYIGIGLIVLYLAGFLG